MTQPLERDQDESEQPATATDDHLVRNREDDDAQGHIYTGALQDKNQQP